MNLKFKFLPLYNYFILEVISRTCFGKLQSSAAMFFIQILFSWAITIIDRVTQKDAVLDTFPNAFSHMQLPNCDNFPNGNFPSACNFPSGNFPKVRLSEAPHAAFGACSGIGWARGLTAAARTDL